VRVCVRFAYMLILYGGIRKVQQSL
jgi:hypothetical protein